MGAFAYFGGVAELLVPDQLKSAVTRASRYEPGLQSTYEEMAEHYGTAVMPARPRKPKDKAKAEVAVQIVQRWILAVLRHETFFSLAELNGRIRALLDQLNDRPMRSYRASRRELFEKLDQPVLRSLPILPFVFAERKFAKVNIDDHVELEGHYYSVPDALVGEKIELRFSAGTLEVYWPARRLASTQWTRAQAPRSSLNQALVHAQVASEASRMDAHAVHPPGGVHRSIHG